MLFYSFHFPSDVQPPGSFKVGLQQLNSYHVLGGAKEGSSETNTGRQCVILFFWVCVADVIEVGSEDGMIRRRDILISQTLLPSAGLPACQLSSSVSTNGTPSWLETSSRCRELFSFHRALPKLFKSLIWRSEEPEVLGVCILGFHESTHLV